MVHIVVLHEYSPYIITSFLLCISNKSPMLLSLR
nr:MAG TPA: hypothetical protein [Caudoviricetes sp.]